MLGRLIQTAANYGKSNASLESATEEAHTRNLLYGQSQHVYSLAQSPPTSPFASPSSRPGSFDDHGGLELEEKDLRLIIAQDAYGAEERPTVLLDSNTTTASIQTSPSHIRHASTTQAGTRTPLPSDWRPGATHTQVKSQRDASFRNRSSTVSSAPTAWTRQLRETFTREEALLECMFGVTSSTKATSTIKMHIIPGKQRPDSPGTSSRGIAVNESAETTARRMPMVRSRTSNFSPRSQLPTLSSLDADNTSHDAVLITRLFHVSLPESVGTKDQTVPPSAVDVAAPNSQSTPYSAEYGSPKKPKLVERKVPAFAIGLILHLPRSSTTRPASTRPTSRATQNQPFSTNSGSYVTNSHGSWTFLNATPELLTPSQIPMGDTDRRIDIVVNNWEIILRAITSLEQEASRVIFEQLDKTLRQVSGPSQKVPKEKAMQRINQRVISITEPAMIAERRSLVQACRHAIRRVCYALRTPRVVTGLGFVAGHWSDEARTLYRVCGRRQQNFFLFTLLTAFLGNHTQWLQKLAPDCYRRQFRTARKLQSENQVLAPRTVIVCDQRTIARRLLFVLASFLPASSGLDGLQKIGEDFSLAGRFSTSSPSSQVARMESLRRAANRKLRDTRLQSTSNDKSMLSTSASSTDSMTPYMPKDRSQRYVARKNSDAMSIKGLHGLSQPDMDTRKTGAGTTSAITPHPTTPVAYFSTKQDSYFPEGVLAETNESVASADLAKILRRSSSSGGTASNVSSRWGSLVSGFSDLWSQRQFQPGDVSAHTSVSPSESTIDRRLQQAKAQTPTLVAMTTAVNSDNAPRTNNGIPRSKPAVDAVHMDSTPPRPQSPFKSLAATPKLKVDDKDGVIDVDLDWPGFFAFSADSALFSPTKRSDRLSAASAGDGNESIRSLRSIPTLSPKAPVSEETSVAGFLRRHHQDFAVHAVKPYVELDDDIKRSMLMEPLPAVEQSNTTASTDPEDWTEVCSTLVADVRTFSIRRLVLKRRLRQAMQDDEDESAAQSSETPARLTRRVTFSKVEQEIVEEDVKDFDTTLADAVERVLNLAEALQPYHSRSPKAGHTRAMSSSTTRSDKFAASPSFNSNMLSISQEYAKQDCRQVIIGALEDIVKDVNNGLDKQQRGRAIQEMRHVSNASTLKDVKPDNLLREGVKKWLQEVSEMRVEH